MATFEVRLKALNTSITVNITGNNLMSGGTSISSGTGIVLTSVTGQNLIITGDNVTVFVLKINNVSEAHIEKLSPEMTSVENMLGAQHFMTKFTVSHPDVTINILAMNGFIYDAHKLIEFPFINTSKVTNLSGAFENIYEVSIFPKIDTSNVTDFSFAWYQCKNMVNFPSIDTSSGLDFQHCWAYSNIKNFPKLDTSNATNLYGAFRSNFIVEAMPLIDTSKATNMGKMFRACTNLKCIGGLDTTSNTNTSSMFIDCSSLVAPNVSEQADLINVAAGGAVYVNKESTSPCYIPPKGRFESKTNNMLGMSITDGKAEIIVSELK